jgi:uncharacterized peroxidase-related enzyme
MTYLRTPAESPLYAPDLAAMGYLPNYTKVFALAPEVYAAWQQLNKTVKAGMELRRYELVTLAAARRLGSAYCSLAHAKVLRDKFYDQQTLNAIVTDHHHAGLEPVDVAIMDFADLVAADPTRVTHADAEKLRSFGLSEEEIFHIVLAVSIRRFFSGALSAVDATPDPAYDALDPDLRAALPTTA